MEYGHIRWLEPEYIGGRFVPKACHDDAAELFRCCLQRHVLSGCTGFNVYVAATANTVWWLLGKFMGRRNEIRTNGDYCGRLADPGLIVDRTPLQFRSYIAVTDPCWNTAVCRRLEYPGVMAFDAACRDEQPERL